MLKANDFFLCSNLQTVFLIKKNPTDLDDEETTEIITSLQSLGIPLNVYIGAYTNTSHVHAIEDQRKFEGISNDSPKKGS